jgi:hypothetical protein
VSDYWAPAAARIAPWLPNRRGSEIARQDTPLAHMFQHARWARLADGADEVHQMRIAQRAIAAWKKDGKTHAATGDLPI